MLCEWRWDVKSVGIGGGWGVQMQRWDVCENASLWKVPHGIPAENNTLNKKRISKQERG